MYPFLLERHVSVLFVHLLPSAALTLSLPFSASACYTHTHTLGDRVASEPLASVVEAVTKFTQHSACELATAQQPRALTEEVLLLF